MVISVTGAGLTVSVAVPNIPVAGSVALIVVMPAVTAWASPLGPSAPLLMVATFVFEELQITDDVRSKCAFSA